MEWLQPNERNDQPAPATSARQEGVVPAPREAGEGLVSPTAPSAPVAGGAGSVSAGTANIWTLRTALVIGLSITLVVCSSVAVIVMYQYNRLAEPDRSTPAVVVRQYVGALFGPREDSATRAFTCGDTRPGQIRSLWDEVMAREARYSITIAVSATNLEAAVAGDSGTVEADLRIDTPEADGSTSRSTQRWRFDVRDSDGWRVCDTARVG